MAGKTTKKAGRVVARGAGKGGVILEKSAGGVVFAGGDEGGVEYLLIKAKYWEFPKGLVEVGEEERDAAQREVREETGLEVVLVEGFREAIGYFYRRREGGLVKKEVVYFLGEA